MHFSALWQTLAMETREWLMDHNGEALSDAVLEEIVTANGGSDDPTWYSEDADGSPRLSDRIVDWIEAVANDEEPLGEA